MVEKTINTENLEYLKKKCSDAGIKLTHQRLEIFSELTKSSGHPSVDEVYERLQKRNPSIAIDTVYRTLATFDEIGVIKKLHIKGEKALIDKNLDCHHHFVCTQCKGIQDIYWPEFDRSAPPIQAQDIGEVTSRHLEIRGICSDCIAANNKNKD